MLIRPLLALLAVLLALPFTAAAQSGSGPDGLWRGEASCQRGNRDEIFRIDAAAFDGGRHLFVRVAQQGGKRPGRPVIALLVAPDGLAAQPAELEILRNKGSLREPAFGFEAGEDRLIGSLRRCERFVFERMAPDSDTAPAAGDWTGVIEGCRFGEATAELDMIPGLDGAVFADVSLMINPARRPAPARTFLIGTRTAEGGVSFDTVLTLNRMRDGSRTRTSWTSRDFVLGPLSEDGPLTGQARRCGRISFTRPDAEPEAPPEVVEPAPAPLPVVVESPLAGAWEGEAVCGASLPMLFEVEGSSDGRLTARATYIPDGAINRGALQLDMLGERQDADNTRFVTASRQPRGRTQPGNFVLMEGADPDALSGRFETGGCTALRLTRLTPESPSMRPTAVAADGGLLSTLSDTRARCEAVADWMARFTTENPEVRYSGTTLDRVFPRMVLLFGDDDFVPLFGTPYDSAPLDERVALTREVSQRCANDPFLRERFQWFQTVSRGLRQKEDDPSRSFGYPAIQHVVRESRRLRHDIADALASAGPDSVLTESAASLGRLVERIDAQTMLLWPSEAARLRRTLRGELGAVARRDAEADFQRIAAIEGDEPKLAAMTEAASGRTAYHRYLEAADRAALLERYEAAEDALATPTLTPLVEAIEAQPMALASFVEIDAREAEAEAVLRHMLATVAKPWRMRIAAKRQAVFEGLVSRAVTALKATAPDRPGIAASAAWKADFEADFRAFRSSPLYGRTLADWKTHRNALLKAAVTGFESDLDRLARGDASGKQALLAAYLPLEGDRRLPASLEYEILAARD